MDFDIACTYTRPWKRARTSVAGSELATERAQGWGAEPIRQTKDNKSNNASAVEDAEGQQSDPDAAYSGRLAKQYRRHVDEPLGQAWRAFAVASESTIWALLNAYHRVVYPIFPLFHHETLLKRLRNHDHLKDRGFFACVMAACALASARGRDGALAAWQADSAQSVPVPSETFYAAARDAIPKDTHCANEFEYLRACALLAIVSIQYGKIDAVHEHLGNYFTLSATQRFYDEPQWPAHLSRVEREERRRLFWSTYTLDVYSSIVWSGQMRSREAHVQVPYPSEADDDKLETSAIGLVDPSCWLHGWNFTTDLYRVLEHTVDKLRSRHAFSGPLRPMQAAFATDSFSGPVVLQSVLDVYARLPSRFKTIPSVTGEQAHDIFGFQAANIQATLQLLRIVLFSAEENVDMDQKCNVAADLLSVFHNAPVAYLKAISTPLVSFRYTSAFTRFKRNSYGDGNRTGVRAVPLHHQFRKEDISNTSAKKEPCSSAGAVALSLTSRHSPCPATTACPTAAFATH